MVAGCCLLAAGSASAYDKAAVEAALDKKFMPQDTEMSTWCSTFRRLEAMDKAADESWGKLKTVEEYNAHRMKLRKKLIEAIGGLPERCPLNAKVLKKAKGDGWSAEAVTFESVPGVLVTANLFLPDPVKFKPPYPAVIVSCGHDTRGKGALAYNRMAAMMAKASMAAFVYDPMEQGERRHRPGIWHDVVGVRGIMLGAHSALIRIWDGMRAIDYVETRQEIDKTRIGCCGSSGGGTMTSLMMTADERIKAAAPSCYITSLRELCDHMGPQDMEQNIYGQLAFGLNHAGYVLTPAIPVLQCGTYNDFFPYTGFIESHRVVENAARKLGFADRHEFIDVPGPHRWMESTRTATVNWFRYWLRGEKDALPLDRHALRTLDFTWDPKTFAGYDTGLVTQDDESGGWATPTGSTLNVTGSKDILDALRERLAALENARRPMTAAERQAKVRGLARISAPGKTKAIRIGEDERVGGDLTVERYALVFEDGYALPAALFIPDDARGAPYIITGDAGRRATIDWVLYALYGPDRSPALAVDLAAWGDLRCDVKERKEECVAAMCYLMGETLVGRRASELFCCADFLRKRLGTAERCPVIACGRAAIPVAHAAAADPGRIGPVSMRDVPKSWHDSVTIVDGAPPMADVVPGALEFYDWPELVK